MKRRIWNMIANSTHYLDLVSLLKRVRLRKKGVSLHDIIEVFIEKLQNDEIVTRANGVAFNFTLAIFPAIIFIFTLIPYIQISNLPDLDQEIMQFLEGWMPAPMYDVASSTIEDIISNRRGGLLSFGFIFSLFLATNGMMSLMKAFNKCYKTVESRSFFQSRFIATSLTFMLAVVLFFAMLLLVIGQQAINFLETWIDIESYVFILVLTLRFIVLFFIFLVAISSIYYLAPAVHDRWQFFSPGSLTAAFLSLVVTFAFTYYINNFAAYNKFYGSIGVLIALMVWLLLLSVIMLIGFEINASIDKSARSNKVFNTAETKESD
ncbi:MAG: YihY/virulence factor BrkB family protein [Bacteroidetes bacterium]|nr:MAG: YihY/virulence factor BrkB family protein [Bacteroidota bacterium]